MHNFTFKKNEVTWLGGSWTALSFPSSTSEEVLPLTTSFSPPAYLSPILLGSNLRRHLPRWQTNSFKSGVKYTFWWRHGLVASDRLPQPVLETRKLRLLAIIF